MKGGKCGDFIKPVFLKKVVKFTKIDHQRFLVVLISRFEGNTFETLKSIIICFPETFIVLLQLGTK